MLGTTREKNKIASFEFLFDSAKSLLGDGVAPAKPIEARLNCLGKNGSEAPKAAIAGAVKSGKSTLANAFMGRDAFKRGAGIITSLVTRARPADKAGAKIVLKGWRDINREVGEASLFLGMKSPRAYDLRERKDRDELAERLVEMGDDMLGEGGYFDKSAALVSAFLQGFEKVGDLVEDEPKTIVLDEGAFGKHRDFSGSDALSVYVDDMLLELPFPGFSANCEVADCQGYDSPNPRHMEKVQEYLVGAHLVVYVISSRIGIREADLRFLRYIKAVGLEDSIKFALNVDLGEHKSSSELSSLKSRVVSDIGSVLKQPEIFTFSALRELLLTMKNTNQKLSRRDELMLELWDEAPALDGNGFSDLKKAVSLELGEKFESRLNSARDVAVRGAAKALLSNVKAALFLAGEEKVSLKTEEQDLRRARAQVEKSLTSFTSAMKGISEQIKQATFRRIDAAFHPMGGRITAEMLARLKELGAPSAEDAVSSESKKLLKEMSRIFQTMRTEYHSYKVENANPRAISEIRETWGEARRQFAEAAAPPAEILTRSVEAYRNHAIAMGIEIPRLEVPSPDPASSRRSIPLLTSTKTGGGRNSSENLLSFAKQWTKMLASGWLGRLTGKNGKKGFAISVLADAEEAVRQLLADETRPEMLNYNEYIKYQVLGPGIDDLREAWISAYCETVKSLTVDLDKLASRLDDEGSRRDEIIPRLEGLIRDLDQLAA